MNTQITDEFPDLSSYSVISRALADWNSGKPDRLNLPFESPFLRLLDAKVEQWDTNGVCIDLVVRPELTNGLGIAHGGVLLTLLDAALGMAALAMPSASKTGVLTSAIDAHFIRPGTGKLRVIGRCAQPLGPILRCEGHVESNDGSLIAHGRAEFIVRRSNSNPSS
jgi:uncharacterized protein (TIGR00369 family)